VQTPHRSWNSPRKGVKSANRALRGLRWQHVSKHR